MDKAIIKQRLLELDMGSIAGIGGSVYFKKINDNYFKSFFDILWEDEYPLDTLVEELSLFHIDEIYIKTQDYIEQRLVTNKHIQELSYGSMFKIKNIKDNEILTIYKLPAHTFGVYNDKEVELCYTFDLTDIYEIESWKYIF